MSHVTIDQMYGDNPMLAMLPKELHDLSPEIKQAIKDSFDGTSFNCGECGGDVIPFNMERGVCFQCKTPCDLHDCDWEPTEDPENNLQENYDDLPESSVIAFRELLHDAARYLKATHGRAATELARRVLTVAGKCVGTATTVDLNVRYLRPTGLYGAEAVLPEDARDLHAVYAASQEDAKYAE